VLDGIPHRSRNEYTKRKGSDGVIITAEEAVGGGEV
jgi:hypothetical protein